MAAVLIGWSLLGRAGPGAVTADATYEVPGRLAIETVANDVDVQVGGTAQVRVQERAPWGASCSPGQGRESGGTLTLPAGCSGGLPFGERRAQITVPAGLPVQIASQSGDVRVTGAAGAVTIRATSGDIDLDNVAGADIQTTSGDVRLDGVRGDVKVRASSGNVRGDVAAAQRLDARTESGDIDLRLTTAPAAVDVEAISGDVELTVPGGDPYRVRAVTASGDIDSQVADDAAAPRSLNVTTASGNIQLRH